MYKTINKINRYLFANLSWDISIQKLKQADGGDVLQERIDYSLYAIVVPRMTFTFYFILVDYRTYMIVM